MKADVLEDRRIIVLSGPEARPFLQGLITNDIEKLGPGRALYTALLTPQGKILFDFLIAEGDGALMLDCHRDVRDALVKRLSMYRLRAKVEIEPRDQLSVYAGAVGERGMSFTDPRLPALGERTIGASAEMPSAVPGAAAYLERRLEIGVPEASDFGSDKMFALDADLDELHAVDFEKGCYVGQELTARMKHRGTARKRLLPVVTEDDSPLLSGDISVTGRPIGEVVSVHGSRGYALIRLDKLEEAAAGTFLAGEKSVRIAKPAWLFS
jgi:folate-binding protein YgfZ